MKVEKYTVAHRIRLCHVPAAITRSLAVCFNRFREGERATKADGKARVTENPTECNGKLSLRQGLDFYQVVGFEELTKLHRKRDQLRECTEQQKVPAIIKKNRVY